LLDSLLSFTQLTAMQFSIVIFAVFVAGLVRGFSGFALSALVMASLAIMIPPIELIVVCWLLELTASLFMVRGGFKDGDFKIAFGLLLGSAVGAPLGLYLTNTLPVDTSKFIALVLILSLALLQLMRVKAKFLATRTGHYLAGVVAGVATGIASVGGMVVALYVLARDAPAKEMRGSLVMYLFMGTIMSAVYLTLYGMINQTAILRGIIFSVPCIVGVLLGKALFMPKLEKYYKSFCLILLMGLAASGLMRLATGY